MKTKEFLSATYKNHPCLVADIGARGGFQLLPALHPFIEVHLVEPDKEAAEKIKSVETPFRKSHVHTLALAGKSGMATLHKTHHGSMSSLLEPDKGEFERGFGEMKNAKDWGAGMNVADTVEVKTLTLADFAEQNVTGLIDFLKLDTQGNELEILKSGETMLRSGKVGVICTEAAMFPVYKEQGYFSEIDLFLRHCGFRFVEFRTYPDVLNREDEFSPGSKLHERPKKAPVGDAWYVFSLANTNASTREQRIRSANILACEGYFSEAKYLLDGILDTEQQNDLFRFLSEPSRESGLKHFLRRWTPPAVQQWRAKRRR